MTHLPKICSAQRITRLLRIIHWNYISQLPSSVAVHSATNHPAFLEMCTIDFVRTFPAMRLPCFSGETPPQHNGRIVASNVPLAMSLATSGVHDFLSVRIITAQLRSCPMANSNIVSDPLRFALHRHKLKHVTSPVIIDSDLTVA